MGKHAEGMPGGVSVQELLKKSHVNAGSRKARRQAENRAEKKSRFNFRTRLATAVGLTAVMALAGVQNTEKAHAAPTPAAASIDIVPVYAEASVPKAASAQEVQLMSAPVATAIPMAEQAPAATSGPDWDRLATCESGDINIPGSGQWHRNDGMFDGGLQFLDSTWDGFGGNAYAPTADQATREQQIEIAEKVLAEQGPGAWPTCSYSPDKVPGWWEGGGEPTPAPAPFIEAPAPIPAPMPELVMPVGAAPDFAHSHDPRPGAVDFPENCGNTVVAAKDGEIIEAQYGDNGGWGNTAVVDHGDGTTSRYAHLSDIIQFGGHIEAGEPLGLVGNTGASKGCHLHVETTGISAIDFFSGAGVAPDPGVVPEVPPMNPAPAPEAPQLPPEVQEVIPEEVEPFIPEPTPQPQWTEPYVQPELPAEVAPYVEPYAPLAPPAPAPETFQEPTPPTAPVVEAPAPVPAPMPEWVPPQHAEDFTKMQNDLDTAIQNFNNLFPQTQPR